MEATVQIPEFRLPRCVIIGQPTRLLDVHTTSPLLLVSPAFHYQSHSVEFSLEATVSVPGANWKRVLKRPRSRRFSESSIVFDTRYDAPRNLAHVLQNRVGPLVAGLQALGLSERLEDVEIIVHPGSEPFEIEMLRTLGLEKVHATGESIVGQCLRMNPRKFPLRSYAGQYVRDRAIAAGVLTGLDPVSDPLFIKRKRRTATNLDEVTRIARKFGYEDVFLEDLPMRDQIRRVATASRIFAFHGAGLGHLYFRDSRRRGCVVEAFSSGFATNWARANAIMMGDGWIGLQGELCPNAIRQLNRGVHKHVLEGMNFHLHPSTVETALACAEEQAADSTGDSIPLDSQLLPVAIVDPKGEEIDRS
jgi:hypothetical protein